MEQTVNSQNKAEKAALKEAKKLSKGRRIWEVDFLRGVCILLMLFDHTMFDFASIEYWANNFYTVNNAFFEKMVVLADKWWYWDIRLAVRIIVVFVFLLLSGISCSLSRSNGKRLLKLTVVSCGLSLVTYLADLVMDLDVFIAFGILHIMALSLLFYICMKKICDNKYSYLIFGLALIIIGIIIDFPYINYVSQYSKKFNFNVIIGTEMFGADCYGIVPYTGVFLIGAFLGKAVYADKKSYLPVLDGKWSRPVEFVGRHTIWIYVAHQLIIFLLVVGSAMAVGYKFM